MKRQPRVTRARPTQTRDEGGAAATSLQPIPKRRQPDRVAEPAKVPHIKRKQRKREADPVDSNTHQPDDVAEAAYASQEYWERRYEEGLEWEWYYDFDTLKPLVDQYLGPHDAVLEVGCGDKPLVVDMEQSGHTGPIVAIDFAQAIITRLTAAAAVTASNIEYSTIDARDMFALQTSASKFGGTYSFVVDKGTIDSMLCDPQGYESASSLIESVAGVLRAPGSFMIISHVEPDSENFESLVEKCIAPGLSKASKSSNTCIAWKLDVHTVESEDDREYPTAYVICKRERRQTRSTGKSNSYLTSLPVQFFQH